MVHLRIVAGADKSRRALEVLEATESVCNIIHLEGAARRPDGDVILCDVPREEASVVVADLRDIGIERDGSISLETVDSQISERGERAEQIARGKASDAVVWEEVEERTMESATLSIAFVTFMVLAALIGSVGIYLDSPILIVGAMVVGPEFGPIAGFCVAIIQPPRRLALQSAIALAIGFPLAIAVVTGAALIFRATGLLPHEFSLDEHSLAKIIASPDFFSFFVAVCAGAAGMLSLSTAKSGALIGVLISVTTIPAAANVGVSAAYGDWPAFGGSLGQLAINLSGILLSGTITLAIQRAVFERRRRRHVRELERPSSSEPDEGEGAAKPRPALRGGR